jgi:endoglucanase
MNISKRLSLLVLPLAIAWAGSGQAATCASTTVTPYVKVSAWTQTSTVSVPAGTSYEFGPQPTSGGSWRWSGCGASGTAREQTLTARASCTATVVYTNACGAQTTQSFAVTVPGMRNLTSLQLSKLMGAGLNLGNSLEAIGGETAWGNPAATQALFNSFKAAGFKSVRIPVSWAQYADANDTISASWMSRVTQVVNYAKNAGLYAIINIHWDGGWMVPTYAQQSAVDARITKFWTQIANNFRNYDDTLLFAGTNEVHVDGVYSTPTVENLAVQNGFNQTFVNAVRATGGNNLARHLVVQGYNTNIDWAASYLTVPTDTAANRLMVEVHFYDPYDFTLNSADTIWQWGSIATSAANTETWANESYVDAQFGKMKSRFVDGLGIPVILGEFAAQSRLAVDSSQTYRTYWDQYIAHSAWTHGAVPIYWDAGATGDHSSGVFNRAAAVQVYPKVISALVGAAK